jgi:hypothetical protein
MARLGHSQDLASEEETQTWLRAHGGAEIPGDLQPESVAFLRRLAAVSTQRDRTARQLSLDAERRCAQHAAELQEVEDVLQQCGIAPDSMPTSITGSLGVQPRTAFYLCFVTPAGPLRSVTVTRRS